MKYRVSFRLMIYNEQRSNHLRGTMEEGISMPFIPMVGMLVKYKEMFVVEIKNVIWLIDEEKFLCTVEDPYFRYEFERSDDVKELADSLDIVRDAKRYGWLGFDKIYRSK